MLSRWARKWLTGAVRPLLDLLARAGATPDMLSLVGLAFMLAASLALASGRWSLAGLLLVGNGIADSLDGELARHTRRQAAFGGFLDSICDHAGDFAFSLALTWHYLAAGAELQILFVFLALFGSMLGSQIRARAGMAGIDTKDVGWMTRCERVLLWILGAFTGRMTLALGALAVLNNVSAAQRMLRVLRSRSGARASARHRF
jgi:CDP-diacylglycerol--glycerol-3-phosphate 3-phosphatidyltransferase